MKASVSFEAGLVESSESFVIVYRNEFGVVCFAYQDPGDLMGFIAEQVQEDWSGGDEEWPHGKQAGAYFEGGPNGPN